MKSFIVFSAIVALCSAAGGHYHAAPFAAPAALAHVGTAAFVKQYHEPATIFAERDVPAGIPTAIPHVLSSTAYVPEHRFTQSNWIQPGARYVIPGVRQHLYTEHHPVAYKQVHAVPSVNIREGYVHEPAVVAAPAKVAYDAIAPLAAPLIGGAVHGYAGYGYGAYGGYKGYGGYAAGYAAPFAQKLIY